MKKAYSNKELYEIAKENYQTLRFHCVKLQMEGYWTQPQQITGLTIQEQLDIYLQALLLMFAIHTGRFEKEQNHFVRAIPDSNPLSVAEGEELSQEIAVSAQKMITAPPILLQLFALRDKEKKTHLAVMFVDTMLNIIIAMAYLDEQEGMGLVEFLKAYMEKVQVFLSDELKYLSEIDEQYVVKKMGSETFKTGYVRDEVEYARILAKPSVQQEGTPSGGVRLHKETGNKSEEDKHKEVSVKDKVKPINDKKIKNTSKKTPVQEKTEEKKQTEKRYGDSNKTVKKPKTEKAAPVKLDEETIARETAKARLELEQARDAKRAAAVDKLMEQLNELVGLESVKKEMQSLVNLIKVRKMRANHNMPQMDMTYHMVFTGNAGTGKTTVARMVAEIYKELGVLSKGTFVETDRAGLVAGYLGQTAMKVKEVVEQAKGGVLFIDEAYSLSSRDAGDDYGIEAIDTLVKEMEDNRSDLVVIVAGYRKEMERFLKSNTGLISRFNKYIDFQDYSNEQLVDILSMMAKKAGMTIEDSALHIVRKYLEDMDESAKKDFGNARGIRNTFEKIVTNQANRIVQVDNPTVEQLGTIVKEDIIL